MQIQINSPNTDVPEPLAEYVERRINEALATFVDRLTRVEVHLRDENGGKGGVDKRCMLEARPRGLDPIAVEVIASDTTEAVRQAATKLKHALEHRIGRLSSH